MAEYAEQGRVSSHRAGDDRSASDRVARLDTPFEVAAEPVAGRVLRSAAGHPGDPLGGQPVSSGVATSLARRSGRGVPLAEAVAGPMGRAFGADFGAVRVHADAEGGRIAAMLRADAFTYGRDVYFAAGRFAPSTPSGRHLIAHELAHVVHERSAGAGAPTVGRIDDPAEAAADRAADQAISRLRRQAAAPATPAPGPDVEEPGSGTGAVRRHGSPEHLILGNIGPRDLRKIPDAKDLLKTLGFKGVAATDQHSVREAIHVVLQERQRIRAWQSTSAGRGSPAKAEQIFGVKIVSLDNDTKNGLARATPPVLATYGELNTLADYFGSLDDLGAISNDTMFKVLQTEREDYHNYLGDLLTQLTAGDHIVETYTVTEDGKEVEKERYLFRPEGWYADNLDAVFSSTEGYSVTGGGRLTRQQFTGTQSGLATAGVGSWVAGMHGVDTVIDADPGTRARKGGGVWGATARNACHFAPQSWHAWKSYHLKARALALEAYRTRAFAHAFGGEGADRAAELENSAWLHNGFGDHYLQDSFASGHLINKTLVMQWYLQFVNDNWSFFGPSTEEWSRLMGMTTDRQPLLSGQDRYRKDIDVTPSGPQSIDPNQGPHSAFESADLVNPVTPALEAVLVWWRRAIALDASKRTITRTELLTAPGADANLIGELIRLPMVLDKGKPYSSYVPFFGVQDRLYMLNESPGLSQGKVRSGADYDAGKSLTYGAYAEFMKNSLLQSGAGDLHNYFCANGLDVQNDEGDVIFRIYGDYVMLTAGGGQGVEISAATAEQSRQAIADIVQSGRTDTTVEGIMARLPSKAAVPEKIFDVAVGERSATETLPLDKWHEQLQPVLVNIFGKGKGTLKDRVTWLASRLPTKTQLAPLTEVVPHGGAEF